MRAVSRSVSTPGAHRHFWFPTSGPEVRFCEMRLSPRFRPRRKLAGLRFLVPQSPRIHPVVLHRAGGTLEGRPLVSAAMGYSRHPRAARPDPLSLAVSLATKQTPIKEPALACGLVHRPVSSTCGPIIGSAVPLWHTASRRNLCQSHNSPQNLPHPFNHLQPRYPNPPKPLPHNRIDRQGSPVSYRRSQAPVPLHHVTECYAKDPLSWPPKPKPTPIVKTRRKAPGPAPRKAKPSPAATAWSMA